MKKISVLAMTAFVTMGITSCGSNMGSANLKSDVDSVSYIVGKFNGMNFKGSVDASPVKINMDAYLAGFADAAKGDTTLLGKEVQAANSYVQEFFQNEERKISEATLKEGQDFLAANKTKDGVITTESGLQYKVITEGTGVKPALEDTVSVNYTGKLLDGTVFDTNSERGEPARFALNQVIKGWSEGVQLMPKGSKYIFWIPSDLAYGSRQASQLIKPNSTLEFEVELLDVIKASKK